MKRVLVFLFFLAIPFVFPKESLAVFSFTISSPDNSITSKDQEVTVNLNINDLPSGDSYFRVGWESGVTYVGYIKNNNNVWAKLTTLGEDESSQNCLNYFRISSATTSASLKIKIGSENDLPNGLINIVGQRFTSTCASHSSSDPFQLTLNLPTPIPTSTPTPTPSLSPSPSPILSPSPSPIPSPTKRPSPTEAPSLVSFSSPQSTTGPEEKVLGIGTTFDSPEPSPIAIEDTDKKLPITALIFIFGGLALVGVSLYLFFRAYNKKAEGLS